MKNAIVIAFTLTGQNFEDIKTEMLKIKERHPFEVLIHGFMPKNLVVEKGWDTYPVDTLKEIFPEQMNHFSTQVNREQMALTANNLKAKAYIIGDVTGGVAEEVKLYYRYGVEVEFVPLPRYFKPAAKKAAAKKPGASKAKKVKSTDK